MDNNNNGNPPPAEVERMVLESIKNQLRAMFGFIFRGVFATFPRMPADKSVHLIAHSVGFILGSLVPNDLTTALPLRKVIRDGFEQGMTEAVTKLAARPQPPQQPVQTRQ